jgi:hypothetical protein
VGLGRCGLDSLKEDLDVLYAFVELGGGRLSQNRVTECVNASS